MKIKKTAQRILVLSLPVFLLLTQPVFGEGEIGAFFTKVNTYIYPDGPSSGKRILVRPRLAYDVVDLTTDQEEKLWLRIIYPKVTRKVSGEGWTALAPHEIMSPKPRKVEIYPHTLENDFLKIASLKVPAQDLELLNVTQTSARFPKIIWQKVKYVTKQPLLSWIRSTTGIYRPGKSKDFLNRVYGEMVFRKMEKDKITRLLSGVIRVGDNSRDVELALGAPLRKQAESSDNNARTTWQYQNLTVQFKNQVVEQIN